MITSHEISLAQHCIRHAVSSGASAARVSLNKTDTDSYTILNGELDKVSHSADRSIYIYLFVEGRYGTFSTNRLEQNEVEDFIIKAIEMVRMLGEDNCRRLPDPERTAKDALTGRELGLFDDRYFSLDSEERLASAMKLSKYAGSRQREEGFRRISEECEYSCTADDNYVADSNGFEGRHSETTFGTFSEMTIEDPEGCKYSGYWWQNCQKYDETDYGLG